MAADGEDFARRRPLYGRFYVCSRQGAPLEELAPIAVKGFRGEIRSRPLHALQDVCEVLANLAKTVHDPGWLLARSTEDNVKHLDSLLDRVCTKHVQHDSTRHLRAAAERIAEKMSQEGSGHYEKLSPRQFADIMIRDLFCQWAIEPAADYFAYHRGLQPEDAASDIFKITQLSAPELESLAEDSWASPTARRKKSDGEPPLKHDAESLHSEILAP